MGDNSQPMKYLQYRAKKNAINEREAWALLELPTVSYGFLGTHGVKAESNMPYVVPMNFAADPLNHSIYLHTTIDEDSKRKKAIEEDPRVTFVIVAPDASMINDGSVLPCKFTMKFESVMAFGKISKEERPAEKVRILNFLMKQKAAGQKVVDVIESLTGITTIYVMDVEHITGARKK